MGVLSITLFGSLIISVDGQPVDQFEYNKVRALLAYLVVESDSPHQRDVLAGLLWPDQSQTVALNSLRNALSTLRQAIGDSRATPPYLFISRESIQFNRASDNWLDTARFTQLLAANKAHRHRRIESCWGCTDRLNEAVNLYRGEFLHGFHLPDSDLFEDWIALKREQLSNTALQALEQLTSIYEWRGDYSKALTYARCQLELDPYREDAHLQAMRLFATLGMRSEACSQYEKCRSLLENELGVEPTNDTIRLYEQIKYGVFQAAPSSKSIRHNNLPVYLTNFVGRKGELEEINSILEDPFCRLLTLLGPGGVGKTRLVVAAVQEQMEAFSHGACFVSLAGTSSAEFIVPTILQALGLMQSDDGDLKGQLIDYLKDKDLILVLDNFEQLIEGAGLIDEILRSSPSVVVLVTSRQCLDLQSEWLFEVNGMSFPSDQSLIDLYDFDAIQLFIQRLHQIKPRKILVEDDLIDITHICQLVEGLPLGIELAVASIRQRPIDQIATSIENSLETLTSNWRDVPETHRSLRAVFEHSWSMLSEQKQVVFYGISVFRGGFTAEAAFEVAGASPEVLDVLVKHSLLRYYPQRKRYFLLEMLRQFGLEKLAGSGVEPTLRQQHLQYFVNLTEQSYATYHNNLLWTDLSPLTPELENCRAALEECFLTNQLELALQLAGAMGDYWLHFGYALEAETWIHRILDTGYTFKRDHYLARTLLIDGYITKNRDIETGRKLEEQSLTIWKELNDDENVAIALLNLYIFPLMQGEYDQAIDMLKQALEIFQRLDNQIRIAATMNDLSDVYMIFDDQNYLEKSRELSEQALAIDRRIGRTSAIHWDLKLLGHVEMHKGNYQRARALFEEASVQVTDLENRIELSDVYRALGIACYHLGDYSSARRYFELRLETTKTNNFGYCDLATMCELSYVISRQGEYELALFHFKEVFRQLDHGGDTCLAIIKGALEKVPGVLLACGEPELAARLYGFMDALREKQKVTLTTYRRFDYDRDLAETRRQLGETTFIAAWEEGRWMNLDQAKVCAMEAKVRITIVNPGGVHS